MMQEKLFKKAKRLRKMANSSIKIKFLFKHKKGIERYIETSHGNVRVLEYGFDSPDISPLYVDMHGGGFILMTAEDDEEMNLYFREKTNVKIVSIDYPKAPEFPYPIAVEAIYEIVKHYMKNATKYKIDPDYVGIGGHSAGANLAAVTCIKARENGEMVLRFQVLDYPPLDLYSDPSHKPHRKKGLTTRLGPLFKASYVDTETAKSPYISPVFATTEQLSNLPPALIIIAGKDSLRDDGILYSQKLEKAGVIAELHDFPKARHGFTRKKWNSDAKKAHALIANFINKYI